jgi:uncharacterized protein
MQALIENLVKLQNLDLDRARLNKEMHALPVEIAHAEAALATAQKKLADATTALADEENLRLRMEREVVDHRQKAARFRTQLDSVKTPAQAAAIEHEIEFESSEADRLENDEYASLERSEGQETVLTEARAQAETLAVALDKTRAWAATRQQEIQAELGALNVQREALRPSIDTEWLMRFDHIAAGRGTAVASGANQRCSGCRMTIRPQAWNQLREGELLTCDTCGRILYWDPSMAPAPKDARPELAPGTGRAPRKPHTTGA